MWEKIIKTQKVKILLTGLLVIVSITTLFNGLFELIKIANTESIGIFFNLAQTPIWLMIAYKLFNSKYSSNFSEPLRCKWCSLLFFLLAIELLLNVIFKQQSFTFLVAIIFLFYLSLSYSCIKKPSIDNDRDVATNK